MGVVSRGIERGKCTTWDCERCEAKNGQHKCRYCGCFPEQRNRSTSEVKTNECQDIVQ